MFEDWKSSTAAYVYQHIDRKLFQPIAGELEEDIHQLCDYFIAALLELHMIDEEGNEMDADCDEDDVLEAILQRFLAAHPCDTERDLLYTQLIDAFLQLVEEYSEDL